MLNFISLIQLIIIFTIFFLFWVSDFIILISFGIAYLLSLSLLAIIMNSDILISFLIIIDLGVFFILISFCIHFLKFVNYKYIYINSLKNSIISIFVIFLIFLNYILLNAVNLNINFNFSWFFFLNYLNYYYTSNLIFYTDMQLFKEIYFNFNSLEFLLISILLILAIICVYIIMCLLTRENLKSEFSLYNINNLKFQKNNSIYFFKIQSYYNQYGVPASSRVFLKTKYDSKINNTSNNR